MNHMKSFEDFWSSISEDEMADIANNAGERANSINIDNINPNSILGTQVGVLSTMMTMQILKRYHEWLVKQLGLTLEG